MSGSAARSRTRRCGGCIRCHRRRSSTACSTCTARRSPTTKALRLSPNRARSACSRASATGRSSSATATSSFAGPAPTAPTSSILAASACPLTETGAQPGRRGRATSRLGGRGTTWTLPPLPIAKWAGTSASDVAALVGLPAFAEREEAFYCHGSPLSDVDSFAPQAGDDDLRLLAGVKGQQVIFGHSHVQFRRDGPAETDLVNPGSVWMPL